MRSRKKLLGFMLVYTVIAAYTASLFYSESLAHVYPRAEKADISFLYEKPAAELDDEDHALIFSQTGLGKEAVKALPSLSLLREYQRAYFERADYECIPNTVISCEERLKAPEMRIANIENGDILVTRAAHILSWRNGHAAIVVDAENGVTLEAVVIGERSSLQHISKWEGYPDFLVLRLKGAPAELRADIARAALDTLKDKPYYASVGIYPRKYAPPEKVKGTQCAHLVWTAYAAFGYDIDSDGGLIVTPRDIAGSGLLEVVQSYGFG